jgi:hypothetical protein
MKDSLSNKTTDGSNFGTASGLNSLFHDTPEKMPLEHTIF